MSKLYNLPKTIQFQIKTNVEFYFSPNKSLSSLFSAPTIHILDDRGVIVKEKYYQTGSIIELECVVTQATGLSSMEITWQRDDHQLNFDIERGGIK